MREMLGPDADDMLGRFSQIIEEHGEAGYPKHQVQILVDEGDIEKWLPAVYEWLVDEENEDESYLRDVLWNVGMQLSDLYMDSTMAGTVELTSIYSFFYPPFETYMDEEDDDESDD